jgi:hypothetical protein
MQYLVKVRVNQAKLFEFGQRLQKGELDRSMIRSETYCLLKDPAVGYSVWEAANRDAFDSVFSAWRKYYSEAEVMEVISATEAMKMLMKK